MLELKRRFGTAIQKMTENAGLRDLEWSKFLLKWLLISLGLHLIAGVMSVGYYDFDEHFQILEFMNFKLGRTPLAHLAGEFPERSRSWMQPTLYEVGARLWMAMGIKSPFLWAGGFRIFNSILGWMSLVGISFCSYIWFEKKSYREWVVKFATLLYFTPYIHARTSSESLGGSFFFLALSLFVLLSHQKKGRSTGYLYGDVSALVAWIIGLGFGFSFLFRFQEGFMILGFGLWCLFIAKVPFLRRLVPMFLGIMAAVALGILLDRRGYEVWTFSPFNYLWISLIQGKAAATGVSPAWYFFKILWDEAALIGILIALGVLVGWASKPTHPLTFSTFLFFVGHSLCGHKETRYLFPLVSAVPVLLVFGCQRMSEWRIRGKNLMSIPPLRWGANLVGACNLVALCIVTVKPATNEPFLHAFLFDHQDTIQKVFYWNRDPFEMIGLKMDFYRPENIQSVRIDSGVAFAETLKTQREPQWLFYSQLELPVELQSLRDHCHLRYSVFPSWMKHFYFLGGIRKFANKSSLFECRF